VPDVNINADLKVGERSIEKLVDAATDAFSPATETLGLLGDAVRLARVEIAAHITRRAKKIADANGFRLTAPPLKFLVPYYEKASIEDGADESLVDMWANLLVSAGTSYDARYLRYTSILSEMSALQARILDGIARNFDGVIGENCDPDSVFSITKSDVEGRLKAIEDNSTEAVFSRVIERVAMPGISIVTIAAHNISTQEIYEWDKDPVYKYFNSIEFEILRSTGLLDRIRTDVVFAKNFGLDTVLYHFTEMGFDFWSACAPSRRSND
jgi:hypothetical protein